MKKIDTGKIAGLMEKWAVMLIIVLALAFILVLTLSAYLETSYLNTNNVSGENIDIYSDNVFLNTILIVLYLSAAYLFNKGSHHITRPIAELVLFGWMFFFGSLFIMTTKLAPPIYSDSFILVNAAMDAAEGIYYSMENYFARFPFQLGYVMYAELFFRVVFAVLPGLPEGYYCLALQCVNLFWLMLCYYSLLRIVCLLWGDERIHRLTVLIMLFSIQPLMSCTFLYGNIPALGCGSLALWMFVAFIKKGRLYSAVFCALALALAVVLKLNLMIFLVAIAGIWLIELFKKFSVKSCLCLIMTLICVISVSKLPQSCYESRSGYDFGEGIPMINWLAMGLSEGHAAAGWYKEEHTVDAFKENAGDIEATAAHAKQHIKARAEYFIHNPVEAVRFFAEKLRSQWNEPSYDSIWLNQVFLSYSEKGAMYNYLCDRGERLTIRLMNQHQQLVFLGALIGLLAVFKRRDILGCVLPLIILGGFMYHILFEAKSQYALPYFILMMPLAALGLTSFFERLKKLFS